MNCFFSSLEIASLRAYYIFIREMAVESVQDKENKSEVEDPHQNIEPWLRTHNGKKNEIGACNLLFDAEVRIENPTNFRCEKIKWN